MNSIPEGQLLAGSYNHTLVTLSILIAVLSAYAALDLAGRVFASHGRARALWLAGGAFVMGQGIWSMHYVGMLAFRLPVSVAYDWPTVVLSLIAAIFASFVALFVVSRNRMGLQRALLGSVVMGAGHRRNALHRHGSHAPAGRLRLLPAPGRDFRCLGDWHFPGGLVADFPDCATTPPRDWAGKSCLAP